MESFKTGFKLFVIAAAAALVLAIVNDITLEPIAQQKELAKQKAKNEVLAADEYVMEEENISDVLLSCEKALENGECVGWVLNVSTKGYGGPINYYVGVSNDFKVVGVKIASHSETPGLGAKAESNDFTQRFLGKQSQEIDSVEAITSATRTTNAIKKGIKAALDYCTENFKG